MTTCPKLYITSQFMVVIAITFMFSSFLCALSVAQSTEPIFIVADSQAPLIVGQSSTIKFHVQNLKTRYGLDSEVSAFFPPQQLSDTFQFTSLHVEKSFFMPSLEQQNPQLGVCSVQTLQQSYQIATVNIGNSYSIRYLFIFFDSNATSQLDAFINLDDFLMNCDGFHVNLLNTVETGPILGQVTWTSSFQLTGLPDHTSTTLTVDFPVVLGEYQVPTGSTTSLTKVPADTERDTFFKYSKWDNKPLFKHTISLTLPKQTESRLEETYRLFLPYYTPIKDGQVQIPIFKSNSNKTVVATLRWLSDLQFYGQDGIPTVNSGWYFPLASESWFSVWSITVTDFSNPIQLTFYTDEISQRFAAVTHWSRYADFSPPWFGLFNSEAFVDTSSIFSVEPSPQSQQQLVASKIDRSNVPIPIPRHFYPGPKDVSPTEIVIPDRVEKPLFLTRYGPGASSDLIYTPLTSRLVIYSQSMNLVLTFQSLLMYPGVALALFHSTTPGNTLTLSIQIMNTLPNDTLTMADVQAKYTIGETFLTCAGLTLTSIDLMSNNSVNLVYTSDGSIKTCFSSTIVDISSTVKLPTTNSFFSPPKYRVSIKFQSQSPNPPQLWSTDPVILEHMPFSNSQMLFQLPYQSSTPVTFPTQILPLSFTLSGPNCNTSIYPAQCNTGNTPLDLARNNKPLIQLQLDSFFDPLSGVLPGAIAKPSTIQCTYMYKRSASGSITAQSSPSMSVQFLPFSQAPSSQQPQFSPFSPYYTYIAELEIIQLLDQTNYLSTSTSSAPFTITINLNCDLQSNIPIYPGPSDFKAQMSLGSITTQSVQLSITNAVALPLPVPPVVSLSSIPVGVIIYLECRGLSYLNGELEQLLREIVATSLVDSVGPSWSNWFSGSSPSDLKAYIRQISQEPIANYQSIPTVIENTFQVKDSLQFSNLSPAGRSLTLYFYFQSGQSPLIFERTSLFDPDTTADFLHLVITRFNAEKLLNQVPDINNVFLVTPVSQILVSLYQDFGGPGEAAYGIHPFSWTREPGSCGYGVLPQEYATLDESIRELYLPKAALASPSQSMAWPCPTFQKDEPFISLPVKYQCQIDSHCPQLNVWAQNVLYLKSRCNTQRKRCEWDAPITKTNDNQFSQKYLNYFDETTFVVDSNDFDYFKCPSSSIYSGDYCTISPSISNLKLTSSTGAATATIQLKNPTTSTTYDVTVLRPGSIISFTWDYTGKSTVYGQLYFRDQYSTILGNPISNLILMSDKQVTVTLPSNIGYNRVPEFVLVISGTEPITKQPVTFSISFLIPISSTTQRLKSYPSCLTFDATAIKAKYEDPSNTTLNIDQVLDPFVGTISPNPTATWFTDTCVATGSVCGVVSGQCECANPRMILSTQCKQDECEVYLGCPVFGTKSCNISAKTCECTQGWTGDKCQYNGIEQCKSDTSKCKNDGFVVVDPKTEQCSSSCTCPNTWWVDPTCSKCSLTSSCRNGGRADSKCTKCQCAAKSKDEAYVGTFCTCLRSTGSITFAAQPLYIQTTLQSFPKINDWLRKDRDYLSRLVQSSSQSPMPEADLQSAVDAVVKTQSFVSELIRGIASITKMNSLFELVEVIGADSGVDQVFDIMDVIINSSNHNDQVISIQAVSTMATMGLSITKVEQLDASNEIKVTFQLERCPIGGAVDVDASEANDFLAQSLMNSIVTQWDAFISRSSSPLVVQMTNSAVSTLTDDNESAADEFDAMIASFGFNGVSEASSIKPVSCDSDPENPCLVTDDQDDENSSTFIGLHFLFLLLSCLVVFFTLF